MVYCSLGNRKQNTYYKLIKENSEQTVAVQFTLEGKLELLKLASRKLQLVTHKENSQRKFKVEKCCRKQHFTNGKQILHSSNDEVSLNQLF